MKIILTESQLNALIREESVRYPVDPQKVLVVKNYLDKYFEPAKCSVVGEDGMPGALTIIIMRGEDGNELQRLYKEDLVDLLIEKFKNMFTDKERRERFIKQVVMDWLNNNISIYGTLSKNYV